MQLCASVLYIATVISLVRKVKATSRKLSEVQNSLDQSRPSITGAMLVYQVLVMISYPLIYVCLLLPLCVGRMLGMAGNDKIFTPTYACVAGAALTSCGWADSLLYIFTRRRIFREIAPGRTSVEAATNDRSAAHSSGTCSAEQPANASTL